MEWPVSEIELFDTYTINYYLNDSLTTGYKRKTVEYAVNDLAIISIITHIEVLAGMRSEKELKLYDVLHRRLAVLPVSKTFLQVSVMVR